MKKNILILSILGFLAVTAYSQSAFLRGEAVFLENSPQEAVSLLETAVQEDPAHVQAFIYLGIAYQQLGRYDDAIRSYQRILARAGAETANVAYNMGNANFSKRNFSEAAQNYTRALEANPSYAKALLNRANARIQLGQKKEAVADYNAFLSLEPNNPQRSQIERMIAFIMDEIAVEERRIEEARIAEERRIEQVRIAQEEARIAEERRIEQIRIAEEEARVEEERRVEAIRVAEEKRIQEEREAEERRVIAEQAAARAEAERRQRLLEEVAASLQAAAEDSRGLSAGNEGIQSYNGEFELD